MTQFYPIKKRMRSMSKTSRNRLNLFLLLFGLITISANAQTIRYVNASATGANNGTSWANAFTSLQSALDVAVSGDQIWVAKGTYTPIKDISGSTTPGDPRTKTFYLKGGVSLYGGFAGGEATLSLRKVVINQTILSGDFYGDDGSNFSGNTENVYHVVVANNLTVATELDGFTISGGNANNSSNLFSGLSNTFGGGLSIYACGSNLKVNNCVFKQNYASHGGGIYNKSNSGPIFNCFFVNNRVNQAGSGIENSTSTSTIANCVFVNNQSDYQGALENFSSNVTIINCTFTGNSTTSTLYGSVIHNSISDNVIAKNCIIWGNIGGTTNGIYNDGSSSLMLTYSIVQGSTLYPGTGNNNADPGFDNAADADGPDNIWGTTDDGLVLRNTSPAVDKGNNADVPVGISTDIIGAARIQNTTVNMGAYENVKQDQTIIGLPATDSKTYGDPTYNLNTTGGASGNPIVYTSSNTAVATVSGSIVTIVGAGTTIITASQAGNSTYASGQATQTLTVNKRPITITADVKTKVYGDADPALTYTITSGSLVGSDALSGSLIRATGENVGSYRIAIGSLYNSKYNITFVYDNFNITRRSITVTADAKSKVYGDPDPTFTYVITSGSLISGDILSGNLDRALGTDVGNYAITIGSLHNNNYDIILVSNNLSITKRSITITADSKSKVYGASDPSFTYTITSGSLVGSDAFTGKLSRTTGENVGTYAITIGTLNNNNYNISFVSNNLGITKRPITVTADSKNKVYGDIDPVFTYTVTSGSLVDGETFYLSREGGEDVGSYAINYVKPSSNYNVTLISNNLTIEKRPITVTADAKNKVYGDKDPELTYKVTSGSIIDGDVFSGNLSREVGENVSNYTIYRNNLDNSNYNITFVSDYFTITKLPITITADAKSKVYGDADPELTYHITSGSLLGSDAFSGSLSHAGGENTGVHAITLGTLNNSNYDISLISADLSIIKAPLTITADNKTKAQGSANPAFTASYSGFKNGETSAVLTTQPSFATTANTTSALGVYPITASGATADNYEITYGEGKLTVLLPANSIKVSSTSVTCKGSNNGTITITATQTGNYTATVTSNTTINTYTFTDSKEITGLTPGSYNVCVSAAGLSDHSVCFNQIITEPKDLSAYARVNQNERTVTVDLQGGTSYQIQLNGQVYQTTNSQITLPLQAGANHLVISTDKYCQGTVEKDLVWGNDPVVYPNPFKETVNLYLGTHTAQKATVVVRDLTGKVVYTSSFVQPSNTLQVKLPNLASGVYMLQLSTDNSISTHKIIKQ